MSETTTPVTPEIPAPAAPVEPVAAPASAPVAAPEPVASPESAPQQTAEAPASPHDTPTMLEEIGKTEAPPAEAKPEDAPKPAEPVVETKPAPTYEPFTLPEGVSVAGEQMAKYTETLGKFGVPQEAGQALIDMHLAEMQRVQSDATARQYDVWNEMRRDWVGQVKSDEQLGGSGHETAMKAVARMRDLFVPPERREAFETMLRTTGVGDHPEFLRVLHNAARIFDEPAPPSQIGRPTPTNGQRPGSFRDTMYTNTRRA